VAIATDEAQFEEAVSAALLDFDLESQQFENVEPFYVRLAHARPDADLRKLVDQISASEPVLFGTFHAYDDHS
jgi:hypothetical protein